MNTTLTKEEKVSDLYKSQKTIIIIVRAEEDLIYKLNNYILPLGTGGTEKNIVQNIKILKKTHKIHLVIIGIDKYSNEVFAPDINIIPIPLRNNNVSNLVNFFKTLLSKELFGIKTLKTDKTIVLVHGQFIPALLLKLFHPQIKVVLLLEGTFKSFAWSFYINNFLLKCAYFVTSLLSIFIIDKIITDRKTFWLLNTKIGFLRKKTFFLANSIDKKIFNSEKENTNNKELPSGNFLLYVGRLNCIPAKNPELLLKSFEKVYKYNKNIKLLIIGINYETLNQLKSKFKINNTDGIHCIKKVPNYELPTFYQNAALTLLTSNFEGTPYTILESLACGTPCITTKAIDSDTIINNGFNGYICKSFSPDDFAELIIKGLELSKNIKNRDMSLLNPIYLIEKREKNLLSALNSFHIRE